MSKDEANRDTMAEDMEAAADEVNAAEPTDLVATAAIGRLTLEARAKPLTPERREDLRRQARAIQGITDDDLDAFEEELQG